MIDASYMAIDSDIAEIACIFTRNDLNYKLFVWIQTDFPADFLFVDRIFIDVKEMLHLPASLPPSSFPEEFAFLTQ